MLFSVNNGTLHELFERITPDCITFLVSLLTRILVNLPKKTAQLRFKSNDSNVFLHKKDEGGKNWTSCSTNVKMNLKHYRTCFQCGYLFSMLNQLLSMMIIIYVQIVFFCTYKKCLLCVCQTMEQQLTEFIFIFITQCDIFQKRFWHMDNFECAWKCTSNNCQIRQGLAKLIRNFLLSIPTLVCLKPNFGHFSNVNWSSIPISQSIRSKKSKWWNFWDIFLYKCRCR